MSNEPVVTLVGNATADAQLRFTPQGVAVASWNVAQTPRVKQQGEWVDGEPIFVRCSAWRELGEHAAEVITQGMRLIVHGRLKVSSFEKDGVKRTSLEMEVEAVGPDLRYAIAKVSKVQRQSEPRQMAPAAVEDPWASAQTAGDDEPPF